MTKKLKYLTMMFIMLSSLTMTLIEYYNYSQTIIKNVSFTENIVLKKMNINIDNMSPGNKNNINFSIKLKQQFKLFISFEEITSNSLLDEYLFVNINSDNNEFNYKLKDIMNKEELEIGNNVKKLQISYLLNDDADNSTQNQKISFYTTLIAKEI